MNFINIKYSLIIFFIVVQISLSQINFTSSNLPIIVIDTQGKTILDKSKIEAHMGIIDNEEGNINHITDPFNAYNGKIAIEIRGHSSQQFDKKQYGFETIDSLGNDLDVSLLGLPKESDWVLNASYIDKSLLRNVLAFKLFNDMGRYSSRTKFCELVINNDYRGVYILQEKIKRDKNRVNITKLEPTDIEGEAITGGYIIKIDKADAGDKTWKSPYPPFPGAYQRIEYIYYYPKSDEIDSAQAEYIKNYVTDFEKVMSVSNYNDPFYGYQNYIDVDSFVDVFLMFEFSKSVDAYRLSTYFHKDRNKKLCAGPLWDFDLSFGLADYYEGYNPEGWQYKVYLGNDFWQNPFWVSKLYDDPIFKNKFAKRWNELKDNILSYEYISNFIDECVTKISEAKERNFTKWKQCFDGITYIWPNKNKFTSYEEEINYLKNWIKQRLEWLNKNIPSEFSYVDWNEINDNIEIKFNGTTTKYIFDKNYFINSTHNIDSITFVTNNSNLKILLENDIVNITLFDYGEFTVYGLGWKKNQVVSISPKFIFTSTLTDVEENKTQNNITILFQNYPNPFNSETIIKYHLSESTPVIIKIYDLLGKEVATLLNEFQKAGDYQITFSADKLNLSEGVYFYRLQSATSSITKKFILIK